MPNLYHPYHNVLETCRRYQATLVVVTKTRTKEQIETLYQMGQRIFGENRVQELLEKVPELPLDIEWHLIGHLQTNKVKAVLPYVACIQSLDRLKLWQSIQQEAQRLDKKIKCMLQIRIARESTKQGWAFEELEAVLETGIQHKLKNVLLCGVMGIASLTEDIHQVRQEMRLLRGHYDQLKINYFPDDPEFNTVSMGMSGDYRIALEEGSTMIRVGSILFP